VTKFWKHFQIGLKKLVTKKFPKNILDLCSFQNDRNFLNIAYLFGNSSECSEIFRFVPKHFEIFRNIKIWFGFGKHSRVFGNIKTVFRSVRETLRCFQKCSTNFSLFQNFQICFGNILKNAMEKFQDCSETFWVVLATCRDCSVFQYVLRRLVCLETF